MRGGNILLTNSLVGGNMEEDGVCIPTDYFVLFMSKQDKFWLTNDPMVCKAASASIKIMMDQVQALWLCPDGLEWNEDSSQRTFQKPSPYFNYSSVSLRVSSR